MRRWYETTKSFTYLNRLPIVEPEPPDDRKRFDVATPVIAKIGAVYRGCGWEVRVVEPRGRGTELVKLDLDSGPVSWLGCSSMLE